SHLDAARQTVRLRRVQGPQHRPDHAEQGGGADVRRTLRALLCGPLLLALLVTALAPAMTAERYPARAVKLVVAFAPGGVADIMGRWSAQALQGKLGQTVIVENKPGGDGLIGMGEVVRAAPDGYTLLVGGFGGQIVPPLMKDDFPFDVRSDIVKVALTAE